MSQFGFDDIADYDFSGHAPRLNEEPVSNNISDTFLNDMRVDLSDALGFNFIEEMQRQEQGVQDALNNGDDIGKTSRMLYAMGLSISRHNSGELWKILNTEVRIEDMACCLIRSLSQMDNSDADRWYRKTAGEQRQIRNIRRTLSVIKAMLTAARSGVRRGLISAGLASIFNFLKIIADVLFMMLAAIALAVLTTFKETLLTGIMRWVNDPRGDRQLLNCTSFLRLIRFLLDYLIRDWGLFRWIRTTVQSLFSKMHQWTYDQTRELQWLHTISWLDNLIKIVSTLIYVLDRWEMCAPKRVARAKSNSDIPNTGDTGQSGTSSPPDIPGQTTPTGATTTGLSGRAANSMSTLATDLFRIEPDSSALAGDIPVIDAGAFFRDTPDAQELERYLVQQLHVPLERAQAAALASASGKCTDRLSEEDTRRVNSILKRIGL